MILAQTLFEIRWAKKKLSLHLQTLSVWQLNVWLFYLFNIIWPIIVNIAHNVHKSRVCQRGCAWAPSKTLLLELRMRNETHLHMYAHWRRISMTQRSSMRVAGRGICFSALTAHTQEHTHTHTTHPPCVWRRVCFQYEGRGSGEVLGWVDECLLLTQEKQLSEKVHPCLFFVLFSFVLSCDLCAVSWRKWSFCTRKVFYSTVRGEESRVQMKAW